MSTPYARWYLLKRKRARVAAREKEDNFKANSMLTTTSLYLGGI